MDDSPESVVRRFLDAWGDGTQEFPDVERIVAMFAPDAEWHLWVPAGPVVRGRDAIRADIHRQLTFATYMQCGLLAIAANGNVVHTERLDHFTIKGRRIEHYLTAVFEVDGHGLVAAWREYFDTADVARQLGRDSVSV